MSGDRLMIVDGNSIMNRAFYGLQGTQMLTTSGGLHTNAVFGFLNILNKFLEEESPSFLCVAFDLKAPTFRHKEFDGYKAQRKGMPDQLAEQMPLIKEVLDAMNIRRLEMEGFEADDIIGSISLCAEEKGLETVILTGDRDSLQLATERTRIKIPTTRGGKTETDEYNHEKVMERYGVTPHQFIDVKGLMGDSSDNIPGVPGIGEKTALELIIRFGSIENLYEHIDEVEKKGVREKLLANRDLAFLSKRIATIERNMPFMCTLEDLKRTEPDRAKLYELFRKLEFKSLIAKYHLEAPAVQMTMTDMKPADKSAAGQAAGSVECLNRREDLHRIKIGIKTSGKVTLYYLLDKKGSFENRLSGIALSWGGEESVFIRTDGCISEQAFLDEFKEIFEDAGIEKIGHDLKNFIVYLKWQGISFRGLAFDTMIAAYIINPTRDTYPVSALSAEYLNQPVESIEEMAGKGKNFTQFRDMPEERISSVAGAHSRAVSGLRAVLDALIRQNGQEELYYQIELPLVEVLADMEYLGFKVNVEGLVAFSRRLDGMIGQLTNKIYELAGEEFNINSPKQLGVLLFEKLQLPVLKKTKTGYSTDAEVLEQLSGRHEIVSRILEYRQLVKLKSTYAEGLLPLVNPKTGRIHSSFNQTVTATGRISSTEPNLQNIPVKLEMGREIRKVFIPENERYILCDADYSQIELRVLAHITGDENLISAFTHNEDIHTATAANVFGIPRENVTSLMRARAKAVNFGIVYGIGEFSLAKDLGITRKEAKQYIDDYLDRYPGVRQYMHDIVEQGKTHGFVSTLFQRRRYLPELQSSNFNIRSFGERIAMNTPIQGSAADIIKIAMVRVYKQLAEKKLKSRLILQVHDELIIETLVEEKEQVELILKECMENAVKLSVPLLAEVRSGHSWYETK